jgi:hypothetical protein
MFELVESRIGVRLIEAMAGRWRRERLRAKIGNFLGRLAKERRLKPR